MTLYLKYRPSKIAELDLESVREMLGKILGKSNRMGMPHAFLFSGPKGTGKTSAARILAKAINCEKSNTGEPCTECDMCQEISSGTSFDVVEIDAASNRGIDEIRELRDRVNLAPMRAEYKVYIIDEVHMLTTEAANALLKTLEEPPAHVVFVLCTTEPERLPQTVVSRCSQIVFTLPKEKEVADKLRRVLVGEGAKLSDEGIALIVKASRGSFRDAIKILEQVILNSGDVSGVLGMVDGIEPEEFINVVKSGDTQKALEIISKLVEAGGSVKGFIERCVEYCREQVLLSVKEKGDKNTTEAELKLIAGLEKAYERTKNTAVVQLPLEIFVIENTDKKSGDGGVVARKDEVKTVVEQATPVKKGTDSGLGKYKLEDMIGKWSEIMKNVRPKNHSVEALLRSTRPIGFDGEKLELEVFYKFHKDKLESDKCRQIVEGAVTDVFGVDTIKLFLRLGDKSNKPQEEVTDNIKGTVEEDIIRAAEEIFKVEAI